MIKEGLPLIESYFRTDFPCEQLTITCINDLSGSPGHINIGCKEGGINNAWLLFHETIHSFWGGHIIHHFGLMKALRVLFHY
ncbi:MAG: hypothetical protein B6U87_02025 [Candidatus Aenigmarchaeota archaeon ex4484_52]|nr:MAG: hypothetical protein B6U87_02025 [Candidatus Aenigmarchaeota archaeon ex4484_52]